MRTILTHDDITVNCKYICTIHNMFVNAQTHETSSFLYDFDLDIDLVEFGIVACDFLGQEFILATYASEEERAYAREMLEQWLGTGETKSYRMVGRKD